MLKGQCGTIVEIACAAHRTSCKQSTPVKKKESGSLPLRPLLSYAFSHTRSSSINMSSTAANRVAVLMNHLSATPSAASHPSGLLAGQVAIVTGAG